MIRGPSLLLPLALVACSSGAGPDARPSPTTTTAAPTTAPPATTSPIPTVAITTERDEVHFRTPSGNIHCYAGPEGVGCDIYNYTWPLPSPEDCEGTGDWAAVPSVGATGAASIATCVSDSRGNATRVLAYGTGVRVGPMECVSETRGLTCRSTRSRHGFFVSRERYRLF